MFDSVSDPQAPTRRTPTEPLALAAALRASEARYRAYVELSSEGIFCCEVPTPIPTDLPVDRQVDAVLERGVVTECNDAMARMYGLASAAQLAGTPLRALLPPEDPRTRAFLAAFVQGGYRLVGVESHEVGADGKPRVFLNSIVGVLEGGALVRAWGTQTDVTTQRHLEDQLRQSQKMEAVGRLAGGIAHDFNNLLTAILTCGELLLETLPEVHPGREDAEEIQAAARRAAELTKQLLVFSRRGGAAAGTVDCNAVVESADRLLRRLIGEDIALRTVTAAAHAHASIDAVGLEQVIVNLAVNARDAMPGGGTLTIETAELDTCEPVVHAQVTVQPGAYVVLSVTDSGIGMDAAVMAHLFEPFFTTKEKGRGTGLGLATVYGIVRQVGGHIAVYSEPGIGTTVRVFLPRVTEAGEPEAIQVETADVPTGRETVLLVEDEDVVRRLGERVLTSLGYRVLVARDGQDALRLVQHFPDRIDLMVSDVVMPRMSGRELADRLRSRRPDARILFLSGYTEAAIAHRGALAPGSEFLQKPFTPGVLGRRVREVLDRAA